jgi:hypothetical protein
MVSSIRLALLALYISVQLKEGTHELEANVGKVQCLGGVREVNRRIHRVLGTQQ